MTQGNPASLMAERDGIFVSFASMVAGEEFYSGLRPATIQLLYVSPEARGGLTAIKLLRGLRKMATDISARDLYLSVTSGITPAKTDVFLRRMGFLQTGGNYVLRGTQA